MKQLAIIILAAGCSARLGQPKQLLPFINGSLLRYQCQQALRVVDNVSCVLGFQFDLMVQEINDLAIQQVANTSWQQGLSSSISAGVAQLSDDIDGVMLILVDQWRLKIQDLNAMMASWQKQPEKIIAAANESKLGPPVIFPRQFFQQLIVQRSGNGAKALLKKYPEQLISVDLAHGFIDLDTPEQLIVMQNYLNN